MPIPRGVVLRFDVRPFVQDTDAEFLFAEHGLAVDHDAGLRDGGVSVRLRDHARRRGGEEGEGRAVFEEVSGFGGEEGVARRRNGGGRRRRGEMVGGFEGVRVFGTEEGRGDVRADGGWKPSFRPDSRCAQRTNGPTVGVVKSRVFRRIGRPAPRHPAGIAPYAVGSSRREPSDDAVCHGRVRSQTRTQPNLRTLRAARWYSGFYSVSRQRKSTSRSQKPERKLIRYS